MGRWRTPGILGLTLALLAVPIVVDCALFPKVAPFAYSAADAFYYLSVARNVVEHGSFSSDGIHPTNGYHPLWQLSAAAVYASCRLLDLTGHVVLALLVACLAASASGIWLLGRAIASASGRLPLVFIGVPFGVYPIAALYYWFLAKERLVVEGGREGPPPLLGTLYSFVNGMESGLAILAFGLAAWVFVRHERSRTLGAGAASGGVLAFLALARLDHLSFALVPSLLWCLELRAAPERRRFALAALVLLWLPVCGYLALNHFAIGEALPVSGISKTTFPIPQGSIATSALEMLRFPLASHSLAIVSRVLPVILPLFWALGFLTVALRIRFDSGRLFIERSRLVRNDFDVFLVKMAPGVIVLVTYNLFFVHLFAVGHWYQPISLLFMSLTLVSLAGTVADEIGQRLASYVTLRRVAGVALAASLALLVVLGYRAHHRRLEHHRIYADFYYRTAPRVRAAFPQGFPKVFEADDGIVGFGLGVPTMSGTGLMLDPEAARAQRAGHLFEVQMGRGFNVVTSLVYGPGELPPGCSEQQALAWASGLLRVDLSGYRASVLFVDGPFAMVRLTK